MSPSPSLIVVETVGDCCGLRFWTTTTGGDNFFPFLLTVGVLPPRWVLSFSVNKSTTPDKFRSKPSPPPSLLRRLNKKFLYACSSTVRLGEKDSLDDAFFVIPPVFTAGDFEGEEAELALLFGEVPSAAFGRIVGEDVFDFDKDEDFFFEDDAGEAMVFRLPLPPDPLEESPLSVPLFLFSFGVATNPTGEDVVELTTAFCTVDGDASSSADF